MLNKRRKPSMAKFSSVTSLLQKVSVSPLIDKGGEPRWRHSPSSGTFLKSWSRGEQRREGTALSDPYHNKILTNNFPPNSAPFLATDQYVNQLKEWIQFDEREAPRYGAPAPRCFANNSRAEHFPRSAPGDVYRHHSNVTTDTRRNNLSPKSLFIFCFCCVSSILWGAEWNVILHPEHNPHPATANRFPPAAFSAHRGFSGRMTKMWHLAATAQHLALYNTTQIIFPLLCLHPTRAISL